MPLKLFMINTDFLNRHSLKRKYNNLRSRCQKDANLKTPAKIIQIERIRYVTVNISSIWTDSIKALLPFPGSHRQLHYSCPPLECYSLYTSFLRNNNRFKLGWNRLNLN